MALRGSIEDVPVVDVLQFVHLSGKSGALSLASPAGTGWVEFASGNIVYARSPRTRSLGEVLVEAHALTPAALSDAIERQRRAEDRPALGKLLVESGYVDAAQLADAVRAQITSAMLDLCGWDEGEFQFDQGAVEVVDGTRVEVAEVLPQLNLNTQFLLLEAARLFDEQRREREATPSPGETRPRRRPRSRPPPPRPIVLPSGPVAVPSDRRVVVAPLSEVAELIGRLPVETPAPTVEARPPLPPADNDPLGLPTPPVVTRSTAGLLLVGFEKLLRPIVAQSIERGGYRVLGHVPRKSVENELMGARRWPPSLALLWRVRGGPGNEEEAERQLALLERLSKAHPDWVVVALLSGEDRRTLARLYSVGVRSVLVVDPANPDDDVLDGLVAAVGHVWQEAERASQAQAAELRTWLQAKRVTVEIHRALQRESIKLELLRVAAHTLDRAVLLLVNDDRLSSIGAFGSTPNGRQLSEALRDVSIRPEPDSPLERCLREHTAFVGPTTELGLGDAFFAAAGRPQRDRAVLVPLVGSSRVLGVLYGDNGERPGPIRGIHAIELAASQAGVAYEHVLLRMRLAGEAA